MLGVLKVTKVADKSDGRERVRGENHLGEPILVNPDTGEHDPYPLFGVRVEHAPDESAINTRFVGKGVAEGWITLGGTRVEHEPGGPPEEPWRVTHTFIHADRIVIHTVDEQPDVAYRVTENPGRRADGSVEWVYRVARES